MSPTTSSRPASNQGFHVCTRAAPPEPPLCYRSGMNASPARGLAPLIIIIVLAALVAAGGCLYLAHTGTVPGFRLLQTATSTPSSEEEWMYIKEWGIDVKKPDGMKDLVYGIDPDFSNGAGFSTTALVSVARAEDRPVQGIYWCDADQGPIGGLFRTTNLQDLKSFEQTTAVKIGNYYYTFETPQATCSEKSHIIDLQTKETHLLTEWFAQGGMIRPHDQPSGVTNNTTNAASCSVTDGRCERSVFDHYAVVDSFVKSGDGRSQGLVQTIVGVNSNGTTTLLERANSKFSAQNDLEITPLIPMPTSGNILFFEVVPAFKDYGSGYLTTIYSYNSKKNTFHQLAAPSSLPASDAAAVSPDGFREVFMNCPDQVNHSLECNTLHLVDLWSDKASILVTLPKGETLAAMAGNFAGEPTPLFTWTDNYTLQYNVYDYTKEMMTVTPSDPRYPYSEPEYSPGDGNLYFPFLGTRTVHIP